MDLTIPLHALILDIVPNGAAAFPDYEIIDPVEVAASMSPRLRVTDTVVFDEVRHRVLVKLRLGERVVLRPGLDSAGRLQLATLARQVGVPAIWLVPPHAERDLMRGDGAAEVLVVSDRTIPVLPMPEDMAARLAERFAGVTVIGDIHGMHQSMLTALSWARSRRHFVVLLGDVLDYGQASLECADEAWRLVTRGEGAMVLGNHERKIMRWLASSYEARRNLRMSEGNKVTLSAYHRLGQDQRDGWAGRFRGLLWHSAPLRRAGDVVMAHAAVHPRYWTGGDDRVVEEYALFGEPDPTVRPPRFATSYRWVDAIPDGKVVIVGHDVRSTEAPRTATGALGGQAVFLDTGCGKGGRLSSADLRFGEDGTLRLVNLNVH